MLGWRGWWPAWRSSLLLGSWQWPGRAKVCVVKWYLLESRRGALSFIYFPYFNEQWLGTDSRLIKVLLDSTANRKRDNEQTGLPGATEPCAPTGRSAWILKQVKNSSLCIRHINSILSTSCHFIFIKEHLHFTDEKLKLRVTQPVSGGRVGQSAQLQSPYS